MLGFLLNLTQSTKLFCVPVVERKWKFRGLLGSRKAFLGKRSWNILDIRELGCNMKLLLVSLTDAAWTALLSRSTLFYYNRKPQSMSTLKEKKIFLEALQT